jgi:hypothetical protein
LIQLILILYKVFILEVMRSFLRGRSLNIVFGAVLFNLVCELWVHGVIGFMNPILTGSLIILYTTYFMMMEDLIVRYRLGDKHVLLAGAVFGLWHETFTTGSVFAPESPLGINPVIIIIATIFWWGILQSIIGLYFANRFLGEREWGHKRMGKMGWALCLFFSLQAAQNFLKMNGSSLIGYVASLSVLIFITLVLVYSKKPDNMISFHKRRFLDIIISLQFLLSLGIGLTVGSRTNQVTQIGFIVWSILVGFSVAIYRFRMRKAIPV